MTIKFHCPNCDQKLGATPDLIGELVECPCCKHDVFVPKRKVKTVKLNEKKRSFWSSLRSKFDSERSFSVDDID